MVAETKQRAAGAVVQIEQRRSNSSNGDGAAVNVGHGEREWRSINHEEGKAVKR
ncbi:hypothetical protein WN944_002883 [Citrus x changshan-huyou]|uniref:Uncharacterized protein n=1 Tax=Citrus x changshan-huyou TaxID=2935761 RepID=A0AAP0MM56_9ROSI